MYHFWRQNPLFRPSLAFVAGICLFECNGSPLALAIFSVCLLLLQLFFRRYLSLGRVHLTGLLLFLALGYFFHAHNQAKSLPEQGACYFKVRLCSEISYTTKGCRFLALVLLRGDSAEPQPSEGEKISLFFFQDSGAHSLLPGDELYVSCSLQPIKGAQNPGAFDYAQHMRRKGVLRQGFVGKGAWIKTGENNTLLRWAVKTRNLALQRIEAFFPPGPESAILKALMCGYVEDIDPETMLAYRVSGTLHILSVSGMHVGILLLVFGKLLSFIASPVARNALLIFCLWAYALLTGLSPSVLRAVSMCSLFLLGEAANRSHSTWNSMAFSLLVLAAWDTQLVFNAGFQLSFLALAGILLAQQRQSPARSWKGKAWQWSVSFFRISVAAQLFTAPVALYYFHQFPTYFLLGNMLVVPLTAPLMYGGFLFLACSSIPLLSNALAWLLNLLLKLCYALTKGVAVLPGATLEGLYPELFTVAVLYGLLYLLAVFFKYQEKRAFSLAGMLLGCWLLSSTLLGWKSAEKAGLIVYSFKGKTAIDLYQHSRTWYTGDSLDAWQFQNGREPFLARARLRHFDTLKMQPFPGGYISESADYRLVRVQGVVDFRLAPSAKKTVVILEKEARSDLGLLLEAAPPGQIVLSGDLSKAARRYWIKEAGKHHIQLHDVLVDGAFLLSES